MKVKFLETCEVRGAKKEVRMTFKEGSVHDLPEPSARRWIVRRKAVAVNGEIPSPPDPPPAPSNLSDKAEKRHGERLKTVSTSADMKGKSANDAFAKGEEALP